MSDNALSFTQRVRNSFPTPTGFVTEGPRFQNFVDNFTGNRVGGQVEVMDNIATIKLDKKGLRPLRIGVFVTGVDPDSNERVGKLIFTKRMYSRRATYKVPLSSKGISVQFSDLEVAIVSYTTAGLVARVEVGDTFNGENLPLTMWRFAASNLPTPDFFPVDSGAASTSRGALNPILLNRRF